MRRPVKNEAEICAVAIHRVIVLVGCYAARPVTRLSWPDLEFHRKGDVLS